MENVLVVVRDRQDENAGQRRDRRDLPDRLDARDARHVQVHDDDVGRELADEPDRFGPGRRLAGNLDAALLQKVPQAGAEQVVVIHEQDANADLVGACLGALAHRPPPVGQGSLDQWRVIVTVRRPQARA